MPGISSVTNSNGAVQQIFRSPTDKRIGRFAFTKTNGINKIGEYFLSRRIKRQQTGRQRFIDKQLATTHHFTFSKSKKIVFFVFENRIWKANFDGSEAEKVELGDATRILNPSVSFDEKWLFYIKREKDISTIWKAPIEGGKAELVAKPDGFSPIYHSSINFAAIFYLFIGLLYLFKYLKFRFQTKIAKILATRRTNGR